MNFLIDSYAPYFIDGGVFGKVAEGINWLFVTLPFSILRMFSIGMLIMQELLDQSDSFAENQQNAYNLSLNVLNNLGGKQIVQGSILALLMTLSAFYLLYKFFVSKQNFSKVLLHYIAVFLLFVFWFGSINTASGSKSGGLFLVESASEIFKGVKNNFTSSSDDFTTIDSEQSLDETPLFNATIKQTFYYVNTGSLDGTMENGEKIDEKKLLEPTGLSKEAKKEFEKDRKKYLDSIKDDNPYLLMSMDKTFDKSVAIGTGGINLAVTSYPALLVNGMLSVIQIIVTILIICAPVFFVVSFIPACQSMLFKFFKLIIGVLFLPVILGVFLAVFFWANKIIDGVFLSAMKLVAKPLITIMSGGIFILTSNVVLVVIKIFLYKTIWKNKYRLLSYFTDNQVNQPEIMEKVSEKANEIRDRAKDVTIGGMEVAAGAYTGNQMLMTDGISRAMPQTDKAMNLGKYHFGEVQNPNSQSGLDEWLSNQEEDSSINGDNKVNDVEFVEVGSDNIKDFESLSADEALDLSLDNNEMATMFDELSEDILRDGDTVSVDNLGEIMFDVEGEEMERFALEQAERETVIERDEYELDREYPEDIFFRDGRMDEMNEEGW